MRYHDILEIYVTASPQQIEEAYSHKSAVLNESPISTTLKQKKLQELNKARESCLEYYDKNFSEKCSLEISEMCREPFEQNRVNYSCTDCCNTVYTVACCIAGLSITIAVGVEKYRRYKRNKDEEQQRLEEENARKKSEQLNERIRQEKVVIDKCTADRALLASKLVRQQELLNAQNNHYDDSYKQIAAFTKNIGMVITNEQLHSCAAIKSIHHEVELLEEDVKMAQKAIERNESNIASANKEANEARELLKSI